jgi:Zn-dependent peptidase ImmA (M78 family)/transcriptional regulator with XRE-family HTH domain
MVIRVEVQPEILRWARERAGLSLQALSKRFPRLGLWELGEAQPTLKQLEAFAGATRAPVGYLFLSEPPVEEVPIPDLRTVAGTPVATPSPDLLETVYVCQQRQAWYREYARTIGAQPRAFVGSATLSSAVECVADEMRQALAFDLETRRRYPTWTEALRQFIGQAEALGMLVMCSGVVLNNNHRRLDPKEFRGFALADGFAPLVFINGRDTKAAQMFTLAHELAHIWLGQSALSDAGAFAVPDHNVEQWCNRVAAELLVPLRVLRDQLELDGDLVQEVGRLARRFKVSTLVIIRRVYDAEGMSKAEFHEAYEAELKRLLAMPGSAGGQFYLTQAARVSKRFAQALVVNTLEGQTLYRDAMRMLGVKKVETLHGLARSMGVAV